MIRSIRRLVALTLAMAMMAVTGAMPAAAINAAPCAAMTGSMAMPMAGPMTGPMAGNVMPSDHRNAPSNHMATGLGCGDCCIVVPPLGVSVEPASSIKAVPRVVTMSVSVGWAIAPPLPPPRS